MSVETVRNSYCTFQQVWQPLLAHLFAVQLLLWQSPATRHIRLFAHRLAGAQEPPQSTSVSVPFSTVSVHDGTAQVLGVPLHTRLAQSVAAAHFLPLAQAGQVPPQLRSVSVPFCTASVHEGTAHLPSAPHTPLVQSAATPHFFPSAHFAQLPPQFRSVSVPFCTASVHEGTAQVFVVVPLQTPDWQSPATPSVTHFFPFAHLPHMGPPQSTSVSLPSTALSMQVAAAQTPLAQIVPLTQLALLVPHILPVAHFVEQDPPQSASLSSPFLTVSVQLAAAHRPVAPHTPDVQSPPVAQRLPSAQRLLGAHGPPQSASDSLPFFTPSLQEGAAQLSVAAVHTASTQSVPSAHFLPSSHPGQVPPQSTSDSVPFFTPSAQLFCLQRPPEQLPLAQSAPRAHILPFAQGGHSAPPQSTSVSDSFSARSRQVGAAQAPIVHTRLAQSPPVLQ